MDLRVKKAMEAEMKRIEIAEEESRAKSQFLARMSHEIRTPMNAILGMTEIQLIKGNHPPETEETFMQIRASSNTLLGIINDILDLSKVEAGKMEITPKPYEIASLIFDTVQQNLMYVGSKKINFTLDIEADVPHILIGDELRIKQILNNLLSNAFKYTPDGDVNISFKTEPTETGVDLLIAVKDTGQGMTADQLSTLFSGEYIRFNQEGNRLIEGTGLGMNITNRMVAIMHGHISADSEVGVGSTFYVRLPQGVQGTEILGEELVANLRNFKLSQRAFAKRENLQYEHMPYGKVLVVDDVESNLFVARGLLAPYGLTIDTAECGEDAVEKIKQGNTYDIIFMDHMMPGIDGIEAAKQIRDTGYGHPIVALTANTIIGQAELFMNSGFAGFISKPIDTATLDGYVKRLIRDKQSPEAISAARSTAPGVVEMSDALTQSFLRDAKKALNILDELLTKKDWDTDDYKLYTINTHGMKSALANVGKTKLSAEAEELEKCGRDGMEEHARLHTPAFLASLRDVIAAMSPKDTGEAETEDTAMLQEILRNIQDACDLYDKKRVRLALDTLNKYKWKKETREFLDDIAAGILHSDFEVIIDKITHFLA
jgi:CheY-like chemotaxis protein/nitrogen-specific signal transduction histidine kinase